MDWDKLRIFHSVADVGSLTHAGDVLHLSQSAVSRQIRALEEKLNVTLFHRHARGLILTEQGELLYEATSQMSKRLETAEARIRDSEDEVFGELRVTTTTGFGTLWLAPRINRLYEQYPDLNIEISSFADCRGSSDYNLKLTVERNQTILNYLRPKISNPDRISAIAYGESKVENNPGYEYTIVINSFKNEDQAIAYLEKLPDLKNKAIIEELDSNFRILAGIYQNYKQVKNAMINLNKKGYKGQIYVSKCRFSSESFHESNRKTTFKVN